MPMPEEAPVTIMRLSDRSIPSSTFAAVDSAPKGVVMRFVSLIMVFSCSGPGLPFLGGCGLASLYAVVLYCVA